MSKKKLTMTAAAAFALAQALPADDIKAGYAAVNGLKLYYEIHGTGYPLILLHGGLGSTAMFNAILPALAKNRQVIAVDLQGHGHTADIDRPFRCEFMADDVAAMAKQLGFERFDLLGYSLGGATALRLAIQHPKAVRKLVLVSTPCKQAGWFPENIVGMSQMSAAAAEPLKQSPLYAEYARVAPRPADWPNLLDKTGELLKRNYDWSNDVSAIQATTMLVFGDADAVRPAHMVEFYNLLGGGKKDAGWDRSGMSAARLAILPGVTHYDILASPALAPAVIPFLDAQ